ncbi:protein phosphatase 2C domain-containing protein [Actinomadura monticuli]|uniref:Protein phosphatase 2C domain-containing protein n=1 Tax=Actinomadura monticuli TaxID=3097367 RepID=A0ABV4QL83_9ACTN
MYARRQRAAVAAAALLLLLAGTLGGLLGGLDRAAAGICLAIVTAPLICLLLLQARREDLAKVRHREERHVSADQSTDRSTPALAAPCEAPAPDGPPAEPGKSLARSAAIAAAPGPAPEGPPAADAGEEPGAPGERTAPPAHAHRVAGSFPRPLGTSGAAHRRPWLLPPEPGPSGITADVAQVGGLQVRAASIVGPGHRCDEPVAPRQDAYRIAVDRSRRHLVVAIADGMSDSTHSHMGANVATAALVRHLWSEAAGAPADARVREWFVSAARQMVGAARQRGLDPEAVRAAVLAAAVDLDPAADGARRARVWSIADVGAWMRESSSWRQVAGEVRGGYDPSRLSTFLPHHPHPAGASFHLEPGAVLALTTDGIGDALEHMDLGAWFARRWARPPHVSDFVDDVGFEAKGELDDRTAVVVWCPDGGGPR